jgi:hypothetical protein
MRRPLVFGAVMLLAIAAFGGLSVGIPLLVAIVGNSAHVDTRPSDSLVPAVMLAYGLLSLVGAVALLRGWPRAALLVVVPQGFVSLGLLTIWVGVVEDPSLLAVAAIGGAAATLALIDHGMVRRPRPRSD